MKIYKLFPFALAAMAFASCSNEDENGQNPNAKSEIVDVMTVSFTNNGTYANTGDKVDGVGTESDIYHAFVFAREAKLETVDSKQGDYVVREIGSLGSKIVIDKTKEIASFQGVTVGEEVFVIANDPKLTKKDAEDLAHQGLKSLATIKAYKMKLDKNYLAGLTIEKKDGTLPTGQFVMTGSNTVPDGKVETGKPLPVVICEIGLNREMAKVDFKAKVTDIPTAKAFGNVEIGANDGIVVVRLPRVVAPFSSSADMADYFPATAAAKADFDWSVEAGTNVESTDWVAFNGDTKTVPGVDVVDVNVAFNRNLFAANKETAKEYRYTWVGDAASSPLKITDAGATALLTSPTFYVTPNYSGLNSTKTIVVTQATIAKNILDPAITKEMIETLDNKIVGGTKDAPWITNGTDGNLDKLLAKIIAYTGGDPAIEAVQKTATNIETMLSYKKGNKTFYAADIADYANTDKSDNITKKNHFYQMTGTITTMGSATIKDAVTEKNVDMIVTVKVNPWTVVINNINM